MVCAYETVMMLAFVDAGVKCKVDNAGLCNLVEHLPCHIRIGEIRLQIDVGDTTAGTLLIQNGAQPQFFLNGAFGRQRNPLIGVNEFIVVVIQDIVFLTQDNSGTLCRNALDVK